MLTKPSASFWIQHLELVAHPEGGFFKEIYRSQGIIPKEALPQSYTNPRNYATSIYFLLTADTFSAFHRIQSDEIWHFYEGDSLILYLLPKNQPLQTFVLGRDLTAGEHFQVVIPANTWFAAQTQGSYSLLGCGVAPAFDFDDFELANREELIAEFPQEKELITLFTRKL